MTRGRRPSNYCPVAPPPSVDDLKFQNDSWHYRFPSNTANHLSPEAYRSYFTDKTLTWEIGNAISGAAAILIREDDDSVC